MENNKPRVVALGVIRQDDRIFVGEVYDQECDEVYYRPIGGQVEFGEKGNETVIREMREELGVDVHGVRYLGTIENIFRVEADTGHEIALIYEASFNDEDNYSVLSLPRIDRDDTSRLATWQFLSTFENEDVPLYPNGLLELLCREMPVYV